MRRMSLSTIAKKAGVSKPVVYTVLKNRQYKGMRASPQTRERILKIARECGYVAPKSARELFSGRSDNIGIIFQRIIPPFSELVSHLQQEARRRNLEITPYITNEEEGLEEYCLNSARDGRVDAVISIGMLDGSTERYQRFSGPPYNLKIIYYGDSVIPGIPSIHFDDMEAGRLAARHLVEVGCRKPVFFSASKNTVREKGFIDYFKAKGLPVLPSIFSPKKEIFLFSEARIFAREFLKLKSLPDGIFALNDMLAAALILEAAEKGIRVPEDIKIVGCNNTEICFYTAPALTSIDINIPVMAKKAIEKIVDMIEGKPVKPLHTKVPVSLVIRKSTKKK